MIVLTVLLGLGMAGPLVITPTVSAQTIAQSENGPAGGMSMEQVEIQYGAPTRRYEPVGDPPITRWEYADFVVYFEYQLVIHSVARKSG
jgi:hypothetical protein